jgi:hypothetical protein
MSSAREIEVCMTRVDKSSLCSGYQTVKAGHDTIVTWFPSANEPGGTYCANTWRRNSNGTATEVGHECFPVFA